MITIFKQPRLRACYALIWTGLILITLLQSSAQPVIGPAAPPGNPTLEREIFLTTGHIVAFSVLTVLWWWALIARFSMTQTLVLTAALALTLGTTTEIAQTFVPDRSASWFDMLVNNGVTLLTLWVIHLKQPQPKLKNLLD